MKGGVVYKTPAEMSRDHGFHPLRVRRDRARRPTTPGRSSSTCRADLRDAFAYEAGQFCTFRIPLGDDELLRCYSMSSSPDVDDEFTLTVKRVAGGRVSNWLLDEVAEGDELALTLAGRGLHLARPPDADRRVRRRQRDHPGDLGDQERAGHDRSTRAAAVREPRRAVGDLPRRARRARRRARRIGSRSSTISTPTGVRALRSRARVRRRRSRAPTSTCAARRRSWTSSRTRSSSRACPVGAGVRRAVRVRGGSVLDEPLAPVAERRAPRDAGSSAPRRSRSSSAARPPR